MGLVVIAFGLRLAWGLAAGVTPGGESFDDAAWYHHTAIALARGGAVPEPVHGPSDGGVAARLSAGLGARLPARGRRSGDGGRRERRLRRAHVWLRLAARQRARGPRGPGSSRRALTAFFPSHVFFSALVLSETLFTCLVAGLTLAAVRRLTRGGGTGVGGWLVWGLAAGAVALSFAPRPSCWRSCRRCRSRSAATRWREPARARRHARRRRHRPRALDAPEPPRLRRLRPDQHRRGPDALDRTQPARDRRHGPHHPGRR